MRVSPRTLRRRPSLLTVVVALLCAAMLTGGDAVGVARAQSSDALREQQAELEAELQEARDAQAGIASELEGAAEVREEVQTELSAATARVDAVLGEIETVEDRQAGLVSEVAVLQSSADRTRATLTAQIRALYKQGASDTFLLALDATAATDLSVRSHYLEAMARSDRAQLEVLGNVTATLEARRADLDRVNEELSLLRADAEAAQAALDRELFAAAGVESAVAERLADAESEARRLAAEADAAAAAAARAEEAERQAALAAAAEAERRAQAAAAAAQQAATAATASAGGGASTATVSAGGKACPQDRPRSFTDTWGAPRGGGRRHQGTDIFGARGGNVFAITSGTVAFTRSGGISGLFLGLDGDDGNLYYYIHLQDFVASAGQRVGAGELIAHNGDTGNARGTTPHIHFEVHPGGGGAVNPYPLLRAVCG